MGLGVHFKDGVWRWRGKHHGARRAVDLSRLPNQRNHAAYLALRLAVILEAYASSCSDFVADNANAQQRYDEQYPDWNFSLPELADYPVDTEGWRALDRLLVARILNLPNKIHGSQGVVRANIEFAMDDNIIFERG